MNRKDAIELKLSGEDLGGKPREEGGKEFTYDERKVIALVLAVEASLSQFLKERIFRDGVDLRHFLLHVGDFTARLMKGERIVDPVNPLFSYRIDSIGGDVALLASNDMIEKGELKVDNFSGEDEASPITMETTSDKSRLN